MPPVMVSVAGIPVNRSGNARELKHFLLTSKPESRHRLADTLRCFRQRLASEGISAKPLADRNRSQRTNPDFAAPGAKQPPGKAHKAALVLVDTVLKENACEIPQPNAPADWSFPDLQTTHSRMYLKPMAEALPPLRRLQGVGGNRLMDLERPDSAENGLAAQRLDLPLKSEL